MKTLYKIASLYQKEINRNDLIQFADENKISLTCGEILQFVKLAKGIFVKRADILTEDVQREQNEQLDFAVKNMMRSLARKYPHLANHPKLKMLAIDVIANLFRNKPMAEVVAKWEKKNPADVVEFKSILSDPFPPGKKDNGDILEFKSLARE
jgi:hypothetical protein